MLSMLSKRLYAILNEEVIGIPAITINSQKMFSQLEKARFPPDGSYMTYDVERMHPSVDLRDGIGTLGRAYSAMFYARSGF